MKISELRDGMRRVDVEGTVSDITEARTVNLRMGGTARVTDCSLTDDSGAIKLTLWDDQIDLVRNGLKVKVENGYINSFRGEIRLNVGRYGKLSPVE